MNVFWFALPWIYMTSMSNIFASWLNPEGLRGIPSAPVLVSFFAFILRFWNQILICLSVNPRVWAISILLLRVKYRLKWNSFSNSKVWYRVYVWRVRLGPCPPSESSVDSGVESEITKKDKRGRKDEDRNSQRLVRCRSYSSWKECCKTQDLKAGYITTWIFIREVTEGRKVRDQNNIFPVCLSVFFQVRNKCGYSTTIKKKFWSLFLKPKKKHSLINKWLLNLPSFFF